MQEIRLLKTGCSNYSRKEVEIISEVMKQGGLLVFPTETVYGIGADARSDVSCRRIYEAKGRESDNPLIVHVDSMETMSRFAHTEDVEMMPELEKKHGYQNYNNYYGNYGYSILASNFISIMNRIERASVKLEE